MTTVIRLLRLTARRRYWRRRALHAEQELQAVKAQADAEVWRNRYREDMMTAAANFGSRGMVGIQPRNGPAEIPQPRAAMITNPDPWAALSFNERAEFETEWLQDALRNNVPRQKAQNDFIAEIARRKRFNDEPSN